MNTENVQNVGASQEAVVAPSEFTIVNEAREKALKIAAGTKAEVVNKKSITDTVMEKAAMAAGITIIGGVAVTVAAKAAMAVWCVVQLFKSGDEK